MILRLIQNAAKYTLQPDVAKETVVDSEVAAVIPPPNEDDPLSWDEEEWASAPPVATKPTPKAPKVPICTVSSEMLRAMTLEEAGKLIVWVDGSSDDYFQAYFEGRLVNDKRYANDACTAYRTMMAEKLGIDIIAESAKGKKE